MSKDLEFYEGEYETLRAMPDIVSRAEDGSTFTKDNLMKWFELIKSKAHIRMCEAMEKIKNDEDRSDNGESHREK